MEVAFFELARGKDASGVEGVGEVSDDAALRNVIGEDMLGGVVEDSDGGSVSSEFVSRYCSNCALLFCDVRRDEFAPRKDGDRDSVREYVEVIRNALCWYRWDWGDGI